MTIISGTDLAAYRGLSTDSERADIAAAAADLAVRNYCGRSFELVESSDESTERLFLAVDPYRLTVDDFVDTAPVMVEHQQGQDWIERDPTSYRFDPLNNMRYGVPWPHEAIVTRNRGFHGVFRVTAIWGWPELPEDLVQASLLLASRFYDRRDSSMGIQGGTLDFGPIRITRDDADVARLLRPFQKVAETVGV